MMMMMVMMMVVEIKCAARNRLHDRTGMWNSEATVRSEHEQLRATRSSRLKSRRHWA